MNTSNGQVMAYKATNLQTITNINHGFFSRLGGVSSGDYTSLNGSYFSDDNPECIQQNRDIVTSYIKPNSHLITLKQIHSNKVILVTKNNIPNPLTTEADAIVTKDPNLILGIATADCIPLLLADPQNNIIAAIHSGYASAFSGIIENTLELIKEQTRQSDFSTIRAALGPSIKQPNYEVQADFYKKFINQNSNNKEFFNYQESNNSYYFSLPDYVKHKLINLGVTNIEDLNLDTFTNPHLFFSHRYAVKKGIKRGLLLSTIVLKEQQ